MATTAAGAAGGLGSAAERLARHLEGDGPGFLLVVTGAGVSAPSGLATFRGPEPEAVWREDDVTIATRAHLESDPVGHWRWYLERFSRVLEAAPNPAHRALADLESWQVARGGGFLLVTQNIDTLHEAAGSRRLVKVHGSADRLRCTRPGCPLAAPAGSLPRGEVDLAAFAAAPSRRTLPACPRCGALLRAHALFFDERYDDHRDYRFERVRRAALIADRVVTVGTSHAVGVTDLVLRAARCSGTPVVAVDPFAASTPGGVTHLAVPAEELLPATSRLLAARAPTSGVQRV
jgi:NAD-dependent deacetylase